MRATKCKDCGATPDRRRRFSYDSSTDTWLCEDCKRSTRPGTVYKLVKNRAPQPKAFSLIGALNTVNSVYQQ